jgi:hypothetical protein
MPYTISRNVSLNCSLNKLQDPVCVILHLCVPMGTSMTCGCVCSVVGYVWDAFAMFIGLFPDLCAVTLNNKLCSCWYFSFAPSSANSGALLQSLTLLFLRMVEENMSYWWVCHGITLINALTYTLSAMESPLAGSFQIDYSKQWFINE